jgi:hypothetical protein
VANWCNLELRVTGLPDTVKVFRRAAGALSGRIDATRSTIFTPEMEYGESGDLVAHGVHRIQKRFRCAVFTFQGRNDDHVDHFREISHRYPTLAFVLVYSDPNADDHGSFLLRNGRQRWWRVPDRTREAIVRQAYVRNGAVDENGAVDYDSDDSEDADWDAFAEIATVAERKWDTLVLEWVEKTPKQKATVRRGRRRSSR